MKKPLFLLPAVALSVGAARVQAAPSDYFRVTVVDEATGRGVPLAELKTTNEVRFVTDSNGVAAINEPDLMGHKVYFHVKSHGYEHGADMFGNRGEAFDVKPGGAAQIKLKRLNIAERMYRVTGAGIYRDSALLGLPVPLKQPQISGLVMGQDTVQATPYGGKIFWLWGDTNRPSYPLGNFATSSATSQLPKQGGLDPSKGVDLTYWVDGEGFSKKMMPLPGSMPVWLGGLFTVREGGAEYLFSHYAQVQSDSKVNESGLALFNDQKAEFEKVGAFPNALLMDGHPFHATSGGREYVYAQTSTSSEAAPLVRVLATRQSVSDPAAYEGFTCLAEGSRYDKANTRLDRGVDGKLVYGWKRATPPLSFDQRRELVASGKMKADESQLQLRDVDTDAEIKSHGGSVFWNAFRRRWVMISGQSGGTSSNLGELWFSEADTPVGPWVYARKIITHNKYTFYNPTQHPFFDQDGGRLIYLEGTYTSTYSGNEDKTPRYDYNQMMYRLALDDARLALPTPVYQMKDGSLATRAGIETGRAWAQAQSIPFFGVAPERPHEGLGPVAAADGKPLFYALPPGSAGGKKTPPAAVPLWQYTARDGKRSYSVANSQPGATRSEAPVGLVWRNPSSVLALDFEVKAAL